jgi:hypothetical protein
MAYPYNPKIAPAIGNGLGGFPQKASGVSSLSGAVATTNYYPISPKAIALSPSNASGTKHINRSNYGIKCWIKNGNSVAVIFVQYESGGYYLYFSTINATTGYYISRNLNLSYSGFADAQECNNALGYLTTFNFTLNGDTSTIYGITNRGIVRVMYDGGTSVNAYLFPNTYNYSGTTTKGVIVAYTGALLKATPSNAYPILIDSSSGNIFTASITNERYLILEKRSKGNPSSILGSVYVKTLPSTVRAFYSCHINQTSMGDIILTVQENNRNGDGMSSACAITVYVYNSTFDLLQSYPVTKTISASGGIMHGEGYGFTLISESKNYIGIKCAFSPFESNAGYQKEYATLNILYSKTSYTNLHPVPTPTEYTDYFPKIHQRCGKYFTSPGNENLLHDTKFAIGGSGSGYGEYEREFLTLDGSQSDHMGCFKNIKLAVFENNTFQIKYDIQEPVYRLDITTTAVDGTNQTYPFSPAFINSDGNIFAICGTNTTTLQLVTAVLPITTIKESA